MQALFDRLVAAPLIAKVGGLLGLIVLLCGGYYYFFYSDLIDEQAQLQKEHDKLDKEKREYDKRKQEYLAFRNEVNGLLEEQKELLRMLPKADDIEQFIESVQAQIELSGLSKVSSVREPALPADMYTKIPVRMSLVGSYHQINQFFKNVGDLKRIVNIEDLTLQPQSANEAAPIGSGNATHLKANFVASTFQFLDRRNAAGGKKTGTSLKSGGGGK
jgi:type IV pilus assembly protein PilO